MNLAARNYFVLCWIGGVLFLFGFHTTTSLAASPASWAMRAWRSDEGLPDENVTGVVQSPDGYLWVTTHNGLARFDGVRFLPVALPVSPGHDAPLVRCLMLDNKA